MSRDSDNETRFANLISLPGVKIVFSPSMRPMTCPLCGDDGPAQLSGKADFSATMSGEDFLSPRAHPLAAFICPNHHVFFLREQDSIKQLFTQVA